MFVTGALADNLHQLFTIPSTNAFWNPEKNAKIKSHYVDSRLHNTDYKSRCRNISRNSSMALSLHATNHTRDTLSWSVEELGTMSLKPW